MKRLAIYFLASCSALAQTANIATMTATTVNVETNRIGAAAGGGAAFSDDFDRVDSDSLGANWTEVEQADAADIVSNWLKINSGSFAHAWAIYSGTACSTVNQYVKVSIDTDNFWQVVFRYTDTVSPWYFIEFDAALDTATWSRRSQVGGSNGTVGSGTVTGLDALDVLGVTITGTGDDTVVRIWRNPTGLPTAADNWNGDSTPDLSLTDNPTSPVNTGSYVGLGGQTDTASVLDMNDFYGGDIP